MYSHSDTMQCGDYVILTRGSHKMLYQLSSKPRVSNFLGRDISLKNVIGEPFSTYFHLQPKENMYIANPCNPNDIILDPTEDEGESGSDLYDTIANNVSTLCREEIISMTKRGLSSQDIVRQVVYHCRSFSMNNCSALNEWSRKIQTEKYTEYLQVMKPTIRLLLEVLMSKPSNSNSCKLLGLRADLLSQITTAVNFQPQGTYILYESECEGLILAFLLTLTTPPGKLLNVIITPPSKASQQKPRRAMAAMKFSEIKLKSVIDVDLSTFVRYSRHENLFSSASQPNTQYSVTSPYLSNSKKIWNACSAAPSYQFKEHATVAAFDRYSLKRGADETSATSKSKLTSLQVTRDEEVRRLLRTKADGLIVVCKEKPNDFVKEMLQFIGFSRSFVVFNPLLEPLVQLYDDLKQNTGIINLNLVENWLRSYEILPNQTNPEMTMLGTKGYLLSGTVVDFDETEYA